ncbi:MAG TPA: HEAT repeat domain-containing protein, partial [Phycisphaerae bacterium]|nr:HEAT repeat domain-containing protein [Phycisphaerae bacterium]
QKATEELNKMGPAIVPLLEKYLSDSDPEVRQRIQSVLEALGWKGSSANSSPPRAPGPRGLLIR